MKKERCGKHSSFFFLSDIDDCVGHSCVNGTCVDGIASYTCDCIAGFTGESCSISKFLHAVGSGSFRVTSRHDVTSGFLDEHINVEICVDRHR